MPSSMVPPPIALILALSDEKAKVSLVTPSPRAPKASGRRGDASWAADARGSSAEPATAAIKVRRSTTFSNLARIKSLHLGSVAAERVSVLPDKGLAGAASPRATRPGGNYSEWQRWRCRAQRHGD